MAPSREEVQAYVQQHNLEPQLNDMLKELVQARPDNAASWMSAYLAAHGGKGGAPAGSALAGGASVVLPAAKLEPQKSLKSKVCELHTLLFYSQRLALTPAYATRASCTTRRVRRPSRRSSRSPTARCRRHSRR